LDSNNKQSLPAPDKKIPLPVVLIGSFEIAISLLGLVVLVLVGQFNTNSVAFLVLLVIYAAMGAGLLAIQEWARFTNVVLHIVAVPYALYTSLVLDGPTDWRLGSQLVISAAIVIALTRPAIIYKFRTARSRCRD
jgi:hypothetical protein